MNFTLFLNSRARVNQLKKCIEAAENTAANHKQIEFVITADDDDLETINFLNTLKDRNTFEFKTIIGPRLNNLIKSFNNMALKAKGKYLFVLNDDSEIQTKNWDTIALEKINKYKLDNDIKDDIIYCATEDNSVDRHKERGYSSFPIISLESVKALGFFMYEQFVGLGGDSSIYKLYHGINRVIDLREIELDHVYHNNFFSIMSPDLTAHEMRVNTQNNYVDPYLFEVSNEIEKLKKIIDSKNKQ
jgi:hypothetical protein